MSAKARPIGESPSNATGRPASEASRMDCTRGYFAQERDLVIGRQCLPARTSEDVVTVLRQFGRGKVGHVLDKPYDGHMDIFVEKQFDPPAGIVQRYVLRRSYDDRSGERSEPVKVRWMSPVPGGMSMSR